jgi:hypothetical protein
MVTLAHRDERTHRKHRRSGTDEAESKRTTGDVEDRC